MFNFSYSQHPNDSGWIIMENDSIEVTWKFEDHSMGQHLDLSVIPCHNIFYLISFPNKTTEQQKNYVAQLMAELMNAGIPDTSVCESEFFSVELRKWDLRLCDETGNFNVFYSLISK